MKKVFLSFLLFFFVLFPVFVGVTGTIYGDLYLPTEGWKFLTALFVAIYLFFMWVLVLCGVFIKNIKNKDSVPLKTKIFIFTKASLFFGLIILLLSPMFYDGLTAGSGKLMVNLSDVPCAIESTLEKHKKARSKRGSCVHTLRFKGDRKDLVRWCISANEFDQLPDEFLATIYGKENDYGMIIEGYEISTQKSDANHILCKQKI